MPENEPFLPLPPNAVGLPAADLAAPAAPANVEYEAYPVRKPEADLGDFKVQVRASILTRCRSKLAAVASPRFPWHEVWLGVSTLAAGGFLGALPADNIKGATRIGVLYYTILPIIAVGSFVAYLFLRRSALRDPAEAAGEVLNDLPDPEKTR